MVLPVTGPYYDTVNRTDFYRLRTVWKQKMPIDRSLPYNAKQVKPLVRTGNEALSTAYNGGYENNLMNHPVVNQARIRAYDDLKEKLGDSAQLAVTIREYQSSLDALGGAVTKLLWLAVALKNRQLPRFNGYKPKVRARDVSSTWLSYSFGLAPTYQDIYNSIDILQRPLPAKSRITGNKRVEEAYRWSMGPYSYTKYLLVREISCRVKYGVNIEVSNPNLFLANQLGLVNPVSYLVERTAFSFVLDWFFNVSQFLSTGTDWLGLSLSDPYTSTKLVDTRHYQWSTYGWVGSYEQQEFDRATALVTPQLGRRQIRLWGWRRTANAVSLLLNHLKSF